MSYKEKAVNLINLRLDIAESELKSLIAQLLEFTNRPESQICLFGAGAVGKQVYWYLKNNNINVDFFCDNDSKKWGKEVVDGKVCRPTSELQELGENVKVLISLGTKNTIADQLKKLNIDPILTNSLETLRILSSDIFLIDKNILISKISELFDIMEDQFSKKVLYHKLVTMLESEEILTGIDYSTIESSPQYFPDDLIQIEEGEVFVDCGAYIGDTLESFMEQKNSDKCNKYICYELDTSNYSILSNVVNKKNEEFKAKTQLYNFGVADKSENIKYFSNLGATTINGTGSIEGKVVRLDEHLDGTAITFLKMDIEGSEMAALRGGKELITLNKPKCAISIYHKASDLWEIPLYLKKIVPGYRIFIRHHTATFADTVCYAVL
ncbi:FkbM family methyltransferase [Paenibacillus intestini]|nr:FkbM family methyltransferase [Paenibacillus intestini]